MKDWSYILNHLGEDRANYFGAAVPPIIQSSNFVFPTVEKFRAAFQNEIGTHLYSRGNNPTTEILRKKLAAMEGTEDALVLGSGSAAIAAAIMANVQQGDHIICVQNPYAWTTKLLEKLLARFGVEHTFVDGRSIQNIAAALQPNTAVLMLESPNSLTYNIQDLEACANFAKANDLVSIIDNSYASPYYQNPVEYGIDIVLHSGSKYLSGHSDVLFGVICANKKMIQRIFEGEFMTLGAVLSPNDAWLVLKGLRTLPARLDRISQTTQQVIAWLKEQPQVKQVLYPLEEGFEQYELAKKQMRGAGGLFSVLYQSVSIEKMEAFCNALGDTFLMAVSWGGYEALQVPTCTFYNQEGQEDSPLPLTFVRYYIGLEDADYIIAKMKAALPLLD
jgi:cystathionine beta-lyase/cystathionine gamma-synthase